MIKCILTIMLGFVALVSGAHLKPRSQAYYRPSYTSMRHAAVISQPRKVGSASTAPLKCKGVQKIPLILVQFSDLKFTVGKTDEDVNRFYDLVSNGTGDGSRYTGTLNFGSVRDYFSEQSDGQFLPEFEIVGPVTLSNPYSYYGKNSGSVSDVNISSFFRESVEKAQKCCSNWKMFDNDGDKVIDFVFFIFAGEGENGCDDPNTIWPHEQTTQISIGGVEYGGYGCVNELYGGDYDGIGPMCHELCHGLGLPDLYDTAHDEDDGEDNYCYGLDYWDLMDSGCYCSSGLHPCGMSAYEKAFFGWKSLNVLTRDKETSLTLIPMSEGGSGYKITSRDNPNEYYILENRQNTGWDELIARGSKKYKAHGMLVFHVDYDSYSWTRNRVNVNASHPRLSIVPADGVLDSYVFVEESSDLAIWRASALADTYPGTMNVHNLFSAKQKVWGKLGSLRQPFTNIQEHPDGTVTLSVCCFADINGDGVVDTQDVLGIYDCLRTSVITEFPSEDVNRDNVVDTQDVLYIYDYVMTN